MLMNVDKAEQPLLNHIPMRLSNLKITINIKVRSTLYTFMFDPVK